MKTQTAFSLIEVLIVIVVIIVLASVALPNLHNFIVQNRMTTKTNELVKTINYARTESISHPNMVFSIIPLPSGWNEGWKLVKGTQTVKIFTFKDERITLTPVNLDANIQIDYASRGRVRMPPDSTSIQFHICSTEPDRFLDGRQVMIVPTGRVSSERIQCES